MKNPLKFVINKIRRKKDTGEEFNPKLYPARDCVMITTESDIDLFPCKVLSNHTIKFKIGRETRTAKVMLNPHILTLPLKQIHPHPIFKHWAPRRQRYRAYTIQKEGEFTHSPNTTGIDVEQKKRFEEVLKLEGQMIESHLTREAVNDMKDQRKKWFDYIPFICMAVMGIAIVWIMNGGT
jgi:hypothetical protein